MVMSTLPEDIPGIRA